MPKKYGVKEKDLVVSHVVNLVLTGKASMEVAKQTYTADWNSHPNL